MVNALNLKEIDQEQALHLCKFFIQSHKNMFLFGQKGTGKTEIALQAAKVCNYKVNYVNLSVIERPDLAGYPDLSSTDDIVKFKSPAFLPPLDTKPDSIILFDEVDKAPPEITAPLLEILQFKQVNGKKINAAACILTGNLMNEGTYSNIVSSALLDRGAKYVLSFNFEKWVDWAKLNGVHDLILGFLRSNPNFACGKVDDVNYASPSPRGWTLASEAMIKAKELRISDIESVTHIISGFVGAEAGIRFKIWYEYYRKFESYAYSLIDKGELNLSYTDLAPTEQVVFVITACYFAKQKVIRDLNKTRKRFAALENLCKFLQDNNVDHEVQVIGLYNSFDFSFITENKLYKCEVFFEHFKKLNENVVIKK